MRGADAGTRVHPTGADVRAATSTSESKHDNTGDDDFAKHGVLSYLGNSCTSRAIRKSSSSVAATNVSVADAPQRERRARLAWDLVGGFD